LNEGKLSIGKDFSMNHFSRIMCKEKIVIGSNVIIVAHVSILDRDRKY